MKIQLFVRSPCGGSERRARPARFVRAPPHQIFHRLKTTDFWCRARPPARDEMIRELCPQLELHFYEHRGCFMANSMIYVGGVWGGFGGVG